MNHYDFGKVSISEIDAVYSVLMYVGRIADMQVDHSPRGLVKIFESLKYSDMAELSPTARDTVNSFYDKVICDKPQDFADLELRKACINWLQKNDSNGTYSDDDLVAEGWMPMSLATAVGAINELLNES